ncbi:CGNR zinc finger domain-containing protein [Salinibacterium soli]|uniref:CGNR zinc finger domain-containing protein n=1 Tax=Antiquaquibacter soli TaxID=3064523 RepID=A0ABT9BN37_9MICO|nr:CGNR zinc finger domain-containing protein [Protaetiibacter sp. WY-16]MDO7882452.1 CGNR zinc finger domain-containing protein [Protaetiibacter sp. WY-16]
MHFAPDTEDTLEFVVALGNTHPTASRSGTDEIATPAQLTALLDEHTYSGRFDRDERELADVQQTRDRLRHIWSLDRDDAALEINAMLRDANALPYLVRHDHFDWHLHATDADAPLAERIRVEAALALADVIRSDETGRMRVCDADDCTGLLLDLSRNGSKRFCSVRCGNRMNQLAFRERAAAN